VTDRKTLITLAILADEAAAITEPTDDLRKAIKEAYKIIGEPGSFKRSKAVAKVRL